jgi:hypothetical protein
MTGEKICRPLESVQTRVLDEKTGLVEYVASDETLDHHREIIRVDGWKFDHFKGNGAFVDSHDYSSIKNSLGKIVSWEVKGGKLIEVAKWAIDVEGHELAQLGFKMTAAKYLPAVSVGFIPVRAVDKWTNGGADLAKVARELKLSAEVAARVCTVYLEQQQIELSACIIGANPSALAKAYKADVVTDSDIEFVAKLFSAGRSSADTARAAEKGVAAALAQEQRQAGEFLRKFETLIKSI